jgi:hypothetical protein
MPSSRREGMYYIPLSLWQGTERSCPPYSYFYGSSFFSNTNQPNIS